MTAVYVGAGLDVIPYSTLKDITKFICIESLPKYGYGLEENENSDNEYFYIEWLTELTDKMTSIGYVKHTEDIDLIIFKKKDQIVKYYYNTIFPKINDNLLSELSNVSAVIDIGHHPNKILLELIQNNFDMFCSTTTYYKIDEYKEDNIFDNCLEELSLRVKNWYMIDYNTNKIIKLNDYNHLINYK